MRRLFHVEGSGSASAIQAIAAAALVALSVAVSPVTLSAAEERCMLAPQGWQPSLDDVIDYVEAQQNAQGNAPQSALTRAGQIRADLRDAQLFLIYLRLMQALDAKGQAELLHEQEMWLRRRAEKAQAAVTSRGGTLALLEYSGEFARITEERRSELLRRLQELSTQRK